MAQAITCDNGHGARADILVTNVNTGDVQALCLPCFPEWCVGAAAMLTQGSASGDEPAPEAPQDPQTEAEPAQAPGEFPQAEPEPADEPAGADDPQPVPAAKPTAKHSR